MQIHNIAGYKFVSLTNLATLKEAFLDKCQSLALKGTILLSCEGINVSLAGDTQAVAAFKAYLEESSLFAGMTYRESFSEIQPFRRIKVKLKNEIITMRQDGIVPQDERAPSISPSELKQWLDEKRDITILDTRNDYEVQFGTFDHAVNLKLKDFSEFPEKSKALNKDKPIVMFCTGGIRCEKAALHLMKEGFEQVLQLDGGILNYFAEVGGSHYHGECFVFDGRVSLDSKLQMTGSQQCCLCQAPIKPSENHSCIHS